MVDERILNSHIPWEELSYQNGTSTNYLNPISSEEYKPFKVPYELSSLPTKHAYVYSVYICIYGLGEKWATYIVQMI